VKPALTLSAWLRWDVVARLWRRIGPVGKVVEVGPGRGAVGARLAERATTYVGYETDAASASVAAQRVPVVHGPLPETGHADADVVCAFEVLEHIDDDVGALRSWATHLKPGGWLLLSVPAFAERFGPTDAYVGHFRRYDPDLLRERLVAAGFEPVEVVVYGWGLGNALERARDAITSRKQAAATTAERTAQSGRFLQPPDALGVATATVAAPFRLLQRTRPQRGVGLVALAQRRLRDNASSTESTVSTT
jgi:SAM-dependent methyltransferase